MIRSEDADTDVERLNRRPRGMLRYEKYGLDIPPFLNALDIFDKSISFVELVTLVRLNASIFQLLPIY